MARRARPGPKSAQEGDTGAPARVPPPAAAALDKVQHRPQTLALSKSHIARHARSPKPISPRRPRPPLLRPVPAVAALPTPAVCPPSRRPASPSPRRGHAQIWLASPPNLISITQIQNTHPHSVRLPSPDSGLCSVPLSARLRRPQPGPLEDSARSTPCSIRKTHQLLKGRTRTVPERHRRLGVPSEDPPSDRRSASRDSIMTVSPNKSERQRLHRCPLLAWKCMQTAPVRRTQAEHRTCVMLRRPACELVIFPFLLFGAVSCQQALVVVHRGVRIQSLHLLYSNVSKRTAQTAIKESHCTAAVSW